LPQKLRAGPAKMYPLSFPTGFCQWGNSAEGLNFVRTPITFPRAAATAVEILSAYSVLLDHYKGIGITRRLSARWAEVNCSYQVDYARNPRRRFLSVIEMKVTDVNRAKIGNHGFPARRGKGWGGRNRIEPSSPKWNHGALPKFMLLPRVTRLDKASSRMLWCQRVNQFYRAMHIFFHANSRETPLTDAI